MAGGLIGDGKWFLGSSRPFRRLPQGPVGSWRVAHFNSWRTRMRGQRRGCRHLRNIFDLSTWLPEYEDRWRYGAAARVRCVVALPCA
jgi:hypothetical protein